MSMVGFAAPVSKADLQRLYANPDAVESFLFDNGAMTNPPGIVKMDKMWHGLHYLLSGTGDESDLPEGQTVLGGSPIGDDLGYGPARVLTPSEVAVIASVLEPLTPDVLATRFDPVRMDADEIYPQIWEEDADACLEDLLGVYGQVRDLYLTASERGDAVMLWIV